MYQAVPAAGQITPLSKDVEGAMELALIRPDLITHQQIKLLATSLKAIVRPTALVNGPYALGPNSLKQSANAQQPMSDAACEALQRRMESML